MVRGLALGFASALALASAANAADLNSGGLKDGPVYAPDIWTGFYVGTQSGAASGTAKVADPYAPSIFGDKVGTSGEFGGAVLGYNTMIGKLVAGVEADANWADLDGTNTCFAASPYYVSSNCHAHIDAFGTLTARLGTTVGNSGRTLLYAKGGVAWESIKLEATQNSAFTNFPGFPGTSVSETKWGWTVGAGVERALTGRWSVKAEYDYLNFGNSNFTAPASALETALPQSFAAIASAPTHYSSDLHLFKVGTNYKLTGDTGGLDSEIGSLKDGPMQAAPSWEVELGARYAGTSSKFQKDLGVSGVGAKSLASRLTYDKMWSDGGELFARIDTPSNIMVKGFVGLGSGNSGKMNDEDWVMPYGANIVPYSNTISNVSQDITYGTIDAGYDVFRGSGYKVAPFVGYTVMVQNMKGLGCSQIANGYSDCVGANAFPTSQTVITEKDTWQALRLGSSIEVMLMPRLKLTAEAAWLPYVSFSGTDNHVLRTLVSPETGTGVGAQVEASLSYAVTNNWSLGAGGRYSTEWTTSASTNFGGTGTIVPQRFSAEQATGFGQISYKFGNTYEPLK